MTDFESSIPFKTILDKMADGVIVQDRQGRIIYANSVGARLLGLGSAKKVVNVPFRILTRGFLFADKQGAPLPFSRLPSSLALRGINPPDTLIKFQKKKSKKIEWLLVNANPVLDNRGQVVLVITVVREVSKQRQAEDQINYYATHDSLTGVANRKFFSEKLAKEIADAGKQGRKLAIMFIDMDRLKDINDSLGHGIGDAVLKETASRVRNALKKNDLIARWGGDEFVVLLKHSPSVRQATKFAKTLLGLLEIPIMLDGLRLHSTASMGVAVFPDHGSDLGELLKNADAALYKSKRTGRRRFTLYASSMNDELSERLMLENDLKQAISRKELKLRFQPIINLQTNVAGTAETLLRWHHPRMGEISAYKFIPLAESTGIIADLGRWVLQAASKCLKSWQRQGINLKLAVNVSGRQFSDTDLAADILTATNRAKISPRLLEIELTENAAVDNLEKALETLNRLDRKGVSTVIDDFGVGYSSLSYLKRFPIRKLKIDASFVRGCAENKQDASIIKAIIDMAKGLNITVVAEGADTRQQLECLKNFGCHEAQGNVISPALDEKEFVRWMKSQKNFRNRKF